MAAIFARSTSFVLVIVAGVQLFVGPHPAIAVLAFSASGLVLLLFGGFTRRVRVYFSRGVTAVFGGVAGALVFTGSVVPGVALGAFVVVASLSTEISSGLRLQARARARQVSGLAYAIPTGPIRRIATVDGAEQREQRAVARTTICNDVERSAQVRLAMVSGYQLIGNAHTHGWLWDVIDDVKPRKRLEILLLDPRTSAIRASQVMSNYKTDQYREGCCSVLWTLKIWKETHDVDISARLYTTALDWQIIEVSSGVWVTPAFGGRSTAEGPYFKYTRSGDCTLACYYEEYFEQHWLANSANEVDFDAVALPDWSQIHNLLPPI